MVASSFIFALVSLNAAVHATFSNTGPYPASYGVFSSTFSQPPIPKIVTEYRSNWIQHKWNYNLSHIASGFWYNSAANGKVRVDESFDGSLGSSLFDYTNTSHGGEISNRQWLLSPSVGSTPQCFNEYISSPGFPLLVADLLVSAGAVFGGVVEDPYIGRSQTWNFLFGGSVSVTAYLDIHNTVLGYDFWGESQRTKVITRFFNIITGEMDADVFANFPC